MKSYFFILFALQKVSEKVGGAEGTKLDEDFTEMEKARLSFYSTSCYLVQKIITRLISTQIKLNNQPELYRSIKHEQPLLEFAGKIIEDKTLHRSILSCIIEPI